MSGAGFGDVTTDELWWVNQVTRGVKPLPYRKVEFSRPEALGDQVWAGARG